MTSVRRTARVLAGAVLIVVVPALAGCGTLQSPALGAPVGSSASPGGATPYGEEGEGDTNPRYAENHAFQSAADLSAADRTRGEAEVRKVEQGLAGIAEGRRTTEPQVFKALRALGYGDGTITTRTFGTHRTAFTLTLDRICVDGTLDGMVNGLVEADVHGVYIEGTGCVRPEGGH
ncbi:hypothetical protein OG782_24195 [Streptomyces sp. NBC_00876]|uniref:hypothetical protein n=1 Tax=Streptomyces sp. NBC_00876 TaxID=2975853 RepID=UPI003864FF61|nr:hypothetical protein OG782_24195 [Streptomyces sp. NBC_00876]